MTVSSRETVTARAAGSPLPPVHRDPAATTVTRRERLLALTVVGVAVALWVTLLGAPLTSDEAGYLLVGSHWSPGSSLYGDYWVDRPPLLVAIFALASRFPVGLTTAGVIDPGVKLLGACATGLTLILTWQLGRLVGTRLTRWAAFVAAAALLTSPLLGMPEVDGELLALPCVMLTVLLLVHGARGPAGARALLLMAGAGAAAVAAALVKQNVVDGFVLAGVMLAFAGRRARPRVASGTRLATAFAAGALATLTAALVAAASRGTGPAGLWEAVVVFRGRAAAVIGQSASPATSERFVHLMTMSVLSGLLPLLVVALALVARAHGRAGAARWLVVPAVAMAAWEAVAVLAGGSYWLHYLTGMVPGAVLLVLLCRPGPTARRVLAAAVGVVVAATITAHGARALTTTPPSDDALVMGWLHDHARPGDGVVVAYGHPDIVAGSGATSPYPQLWSLPVRVRDPRLSGLSGVLAGPSAPRWVVTSGSGLDGWGLRAAAAQQTLAGHYAERVTLGGWHVWERR
ncbi:hypothetical protein ACQBJO_06950 [Janibacter sp. G349]|uniref:hypothetical protein n=1 Tax=Janibacter sp. G349 TaxID=3405424 RepID=UPI003B7E1974